jgi:hydroxymethylpyrimidine pyrophosphatase-like HAD family hydrolase
MMATEEKGRECPIMIRLVVVDIDGVVSPGEAAPLDFAVLQRLAALNDSARHDPARPAVTLCTGRPAPYVEVLMQAIHGFYPAIYEHGAGLYVPEPYGFKSYPALTPAIQAQLMQLQTLLHESASLSLFARANVPLHAVTQAARRLAQGWGDAFLVEEGATCVNIMVRGLDKAEGVRWLSRETGIPLCHMAGVGDARGDAPFMQVVGWSAAPANAHPSVKQLAHYTSPYEDGSGLVDILARLEAH